MDSFDAWIISFNYLFASNLFVSPEICIQVFRKTFSPLQSSDHPGCNMYETFEQSID